MLRSLDIRDMLIIEAASLEFHPGLNVLTGETGAGKSILLDALGFVLGWRGRAELVRPGARQGEVTAVFELAAEHPARAVLADAGLPDEGDEVILRRVNTADGRKTAWVNDRRVSGEVLRRLSDLLVELHGQHDDRGLLNSRGHLALLDEFAGHAPLLAATRDAWRKLEAAQRRQAEAVRAFEAARAEEDFLRHAVAELEDLAPEPGEEEALDSRRRLMQAAARLREDIARAHALLTGEGAESQVADALRRLEGAAEGAQGRLDAAVSALGAALDEIASAEQAIETCLADMTFSQRDLEEVEDRLFAIRGLARKHGVLPDALAEFAADLRRRLDALDAGEGELARLAEDVADAERAYAAAAEALSASRREAAERLDRAMAGELGPLKMERATFKTLVEPGEPSASGHDKVEFTVATNPGAPPGPLHRIASGGELSRFLLALKVCLTRDAVDLTMIFDEIDRGVGGATADAVGRRLARLAHEAQVLVVTHSPQVAARAAHHFRVDKQVEGEATRSGVIALDEAQRVDELARMLAGEQVTAEARDAARALLAG